MNWPTPEHVKTSDDPEWPRWVKVHDSHVVTKVTEGAPAHVSVPDWPEFHVGRDGAVTVLVRDEEEEKRALRVKEIAPPDEPPAAIAPTENPAPEPERQFDYPVEDEEY